MSPGNVVPSSCPKYLTYMLPPAPSPASPPPRPLSCKLTVTLVVTPENEIVQLPPCPPPPPVLS